MSAVSAVAHGGLTTRTITLVTGDRVTVFDAGQFSVERGKGRETVPYVSSVARGHLTVVLADALSLMREGHLDPRLFDVTELLSYGYHTRSDLPLIVTRSAA